MTKSEALKRYAAHFGAILFNYSMAIFIITVLLVCSIVVFPMLVAILGGVMVVYYGILIIVTIFSLGLLLFNEEFRGLYNTDLAQWVGNVGDNMNVIVPKLVDMIPYFAIATVIMSLISLGFLLIDKNWKPAKSRIVTLITITIITIIVLVLALFGVLAIVGGLSQ